MNTRNNNADPMFFLIIAVVVAVAFGIYQLGAALGLDFKTMLGVVLLSATVLALAGGCLYLGRDIEFLHISETWPLLLALECMAWWPAMNVWAAHPLSAYMPDPYPAVWWNAWYTAHASWRCASGSGSSCGIGVRPTTEPSLSRVGHQRRHCFYFYKESTMKPSTRKSIALFICDELLTLAMHWLPASCFTRPAAGGLPTNCWNMAALRRFELP